jgi:tetratricopeptide (TPR) repeat protein
MTEKSGEFIDKMDKLKNTLGLISGFLVVCFGLVGHFIEMLSSPISLLAVVWGIFILLFMLHYQKRDPSADKKNKWGLVFYTYAVIALVITIVIIFPIAGRYFSKKDKIEAKNKKIGIVINKFNDTQNDQFTNTLYELIRRDLKHCDTIAAEVNAGGFFPTLPQDYEDSVSSILSSYHYNRGIMVLGERTKDGFSDEKVFRCIICINNLQNLRIDSSKIDAESSSGNAIYIRHPGIIDLGLDLQAEQIASFVLGLLHLNAREYAAAEGDFNRVAQIAQGWSGGKAKKLAGQCRLFIGSSCFKDGRYKEAEEQYRLGLQADSTNAGLFYNFAAIHFLKGDSLKAYQQYVCAARIDETLAIPDALLDKYGLDPLSAIKKISQAASTNTVRLAGTEKKDPKHPNTAPSATVTKKPDRKMDTLKVVPASTNPVENIKEPARFPQPCKLVKVFTPDGRDIIGELKFGQNPQVIYSIVISHDLVFTDGNGQCWKIGRAVPTMNLTRQWRITDNCGNQWLTDGDEYIISGKDRVGKAYFFGD